MRNKTISISEELFELLKKEDNASELITRVMWDHYNSLKETKIPENRPILDVLEESNSKSIKESQNNNLRDILLKEIAEQEKADALFDSNKGTDFYENR